MNNNNSTRLLSEEDLAKITGGKNPNDKSESTPMFDDKNTNFKINLKECAERYTEGLICSPRITVDGIKNKNPEEISAGLGIGTTLGLAAFLGAGIDEAAHAINRNKNKIKNLFIR